MSPNTCYYGAAGAALFDIVNVHFGRGAEPRRTIEGRFHSGSGAASLFGNGNAGLAHRAERSSRKREAGGSSPPASTKRNNALVAKRQTQPPQKRPPIAAWRFKSFRVH